MHNLASLYFSRGRFDDAERLYAQTLELSRRVLGPEHPDTLNTTHYLARIYKERGRFEAQDLHAQTLEVKCRVLGPRLPTHSVDGQPRDGKLLGATKNNRLRLPPTSRAGPEHPDTLAT